MQTKIVPNLKNPFLTENIIAYIGNKRRLLPLIHRAIVRCHDEGGGQREHSLRFFDVFSGSGIVARLAKTLDYRVYANDWETYSRILNRGFLGTQRRDLPGLCREYGGLRAVLAHLNALTPPAIEDTYIARHYAPRTFDTEEVDFRNQRLFYTRSNALRIDAMRNRIEEMYPEGCSDEREQEKNLLLALLLYQAATRTNTSGVFKACHKGFGGHGRDALNRITADIVLPYPALCDSTCEPVVMQRDAADAANAITGALDIAYLDPPYNQHQYGSNYHLLNTIGEWDKPPVNDTLNRFGVLLDKGGIRKDWTRTRSDYCYRQTAADSFRDLLDKLDARHILVSYSTEGIIPFDEMCTCCAERGALSIVSDEYVKYRGGRQSLARKNRNIEFILMIDTHRQFTTGQLSAVDSLMLRKKIRLQQKKRFDRIRFHRLFADDSGYRFSMGDESVVLQSEDGFLIEPFTVEGYRREFLEALSDALAEAECTDKNEELENLLALIQEDPDRPRSVYRDLMATFKKIAHKKYRPLYEAWLGRLLALEFTHPEVYLRVREELSRVELQAELRFAS